MIKEIINTDISIETLRKALEFFYTVGDRVAIDEIKNILNKHSSSNINVDLKKFDFFKAKDGEPVLYYDSDTNKYEDCIVFIANNAVGYNGLVNIKYKNNRFVVFSNELRMK